MNLAGDPWALGMIGATATPKPDPKPPIAAPATGRRAPAASQLSASQQKVYRDNGLDPTTSFTARTTVAPDNQGAYSLED